MVDKDAPHETSGYGKKMCAVLPVHLTLINDPEVGFVDQCSRVKSMIRTLMGKMVVGDPAQLSIDDGHQLLQSDRVAAAPRYKEIRNVLCFVPHESAVIIDLGIRLTSIEEFFLNVVGFAQYSRVIYSRSVSFALNIR